MTRLLIGYDGSDAARVAVVVARTLFGPVDAVVVHVHQPPPPSAVGALGRAALPDATIAEGLARIREDAEVRGQSRAEEGAEVAGLAGLHAEPALRFGLTPWRELQHLGREIDADAIVCGTSGVGALERAMLGSTASSLLHHAERPLLVCPADAIVTDGPLMAGFDHSAGARAALRFAAERLSPRPVLVAHAWHSPVRHSLRGHALRASHVALLEQYADSIDEIWQEVAEEYADDGARLARELGLEAQPCAPESGYSTWNALLDEATRRRVAAVLVGSRGLGATASTVLGSTACGLVHAAQVPVLVVPERRPATTT